MRGRIFGWLAVGGGGVILAIPGVPGLAIIGIAIFLIGMIKSAEAWDKYRAEIRESLLMEEVTFFCDEHGEYLCEKHE